MNNSILGEGYEKIDILTGLLTQQGIAQALVSAGGTGKSVSVLFIDIDDFGLVNDQHGHAVGDSLLQAFANVLPDQVQGKHLIGRLDDEFVIILPGIDKCMARRIAEQIRASTDARVFKFVNDTRLRITVSIGLVTLQPNGIQDTDLALLKVDRSLCEAKRSGGNRVCVSHM